MVRNINVATDPMELNYVEGLYNDESLEIMQTAEDAFQRGSNRIEEIRNFARKAGIKRIGIAHCITFPREVKAVTQFLSEEFEVFSVDCKCGKVTKHEMLGCEGQSIMCNPAGQAKYLEENKTELTISLGLCVGHDMVFNQRSDSPVTTLVVKDRPSNHNPVASINKLDLI